MFIPAAILHYCSFQKDKAFTRFTQLDLKCVVLQIHFKLYLHFLYLSVINCQFSVDLYNIAMYILQCVYLAVTLCIFISEYCVYSEYFNIKVYYVIILFQFIIPGKSWLYTVIIFTELVCVHFFLQNYLLYTLFKKKKKIFTQFK